MAVTVFQTVSSKKLDCSYRRVTHLKFQSGILCVLYPWYTLFAVSPFPLCHKKKAQFTFVMHLYTSTSEAMGNPQDVLQTED